MAMRWMVAAAAVGFALGAAPASAQQQGTLEGDLGCAVLGLSMVGMHGATPQQQQAGSLISVYYIGRIKAAAPQLNLEDALYQRIVSTSPAQMEAERTRCAAEFTTFGRELQTIGANLQARGAPQQLPNQ